MGTYTETCLAGYPLIYTKNAVDPVVMTIFRESDRRTYRRKFCDQNPLVHSTSDPEHADDEEDVIEYATTAALAAQRLDVMGFTLKRCREEFERNRAALINDVLANAEDRSDASDASDLDKYYARRLSDLNRLDFDSYVAGLADVLSQRLMPDPFDDHRRPGLSDVVKYILTGDEDWIDFGFFSHDVRCFLRVAFSLSDDNAEVTQDITGISDAGWVDGTQPICKQAIHSLVASYPENSPRIIVTEGSSDANILRKSLEVLFPHLVGYYTFFDFHGTRASGGASQLVSVVKAFAATGISNRVIALLDNDTVAREARRSLSGVTLPENITVLHYPPIESLRSYPTLGPSGEVLLDVNGTAASIELYLGRDILGLSPVQWAGYSQTMKTYQGEVLGKESLQKKWHAKAARCQADPSKIVEGDWEDLRSVWVAVFSAFGDA